MSIIRTPDQRLRVFVSSTLAELAPERAAVRAAIERLRLTPVMFELGARPHPPRELYRAYLEQSHVFVGVYWERYGWIAPGEAVSGLEDEYRLAGGRPRLLYLKQPAPGREERLVALLDEMQREDRASYKSFSTPDELARLVEDDLALLLSERFEAGAGDHADARSLAAPDDDVPVPLTETVGRDDDVAAVAAALAAPHRIVTLTGPGGVGKSRLAIEVAHRVRDRFPDGVRFVPLAGETDVAGALRAVVDRLGVRLDAATPIDALVAHLRERRVLLLLDNVEQVVGLGAALVDLLRRSPGPQALVTSRQALRVEGEWEHVVAPLAVSGPGAPIEQVREHPAVRLFAQRASAVSRFVLDDDSVPVVADIVRRLDGLPLAIELAAARSRVLPPTALRERLASSLDVLGATPDPTVPERQRTLGATLDWSHALLDRDERALFARLSVFDGGWTLDAAETVCGGASVVETLASLLDKSLVVSDQEETASEPRFRMLGIVRAYAHGRLRERGELDDLRTRHLAWVREIARDAQPGLCGPGQATWVARLAPERPNLRQAVETALADGDHGAVVELAWDVVVLYFVRDAVYEPHSWLERVAAARPALDEVLDAKLRALLALTRVHHGDYDGVRDEFAAALAVFRAHGMDFEAAVVLHQLGFVAYRLDGDVEAAIDALAESSQLFASIGHDWGVGLAEAMLGSVLAATGDLSGAEQHQLRSLERARAIDSDQQVVQALGQLALVRLLDDQDREALALLEEAAPVLQRGRFRTDTANALDLLAVVAHRAGADVVAATACAVADAERNRLRVEPWPTVQPFVGRIRAWVRASLGPDQYDARARDVATDDLFTTFTTALADVAARTG